MENIDIEKIYDIINFLQDNDDDWSDEIAELYKVIDAIES